MGPPICNCGPTALSVTRLNWTPPGHAHCIATYKPPCLLSASKHEPSTAPGSSETPLVDAVAERGDRVLEVPLHVPGHKRGNSTPPALQQLVGTSLRYDLTELGGLDILSSPTGPILAAQQLAAQAWGATATWFLVNGTTVGIHAAVMATCGPGDTLILARNAHLSAFNAMVLAGCRPLYVQPCYSARFGITHQVTPAALAAAFDEAAQRGLRVKAALVVSPTYFGVLSDIAGLSAICHSHGVPLLVDEAHGAHLGLHPALPPAALQQGADVSVQSTHKQLSAMTQAAMLHASSARVQPQRISRALQVLQTSSPSYLLMASLDAARQQASSPGALDEAVQAARYAAQQLRRLPGLQLLTQQDVAAASCTHNTGDGPDSRNDRACLDPLRLTLSLRQLGLSGYQAAHILEQQHGIVAELATPECLVLAFGTGSRHHHAMTLAKALKQLCATQGLEAHDSRAAKVSPMPSLHALPQVDLSPRAAFFAATEVVSAAQAAGRLSAELLCPYPPGVPAVYPGEVLSADIIGHLQALLLDGATVAGCSDATLQTIRVLVR